MADPKADIYIGGKPGDTLPIEQWMDKRSSAILDEYWNGLIQKLGPAKTEGAAPAPTATVDLTEQKMQENADAAEAAGKDLQQMGGTPEQRAKFLDLSKNPETRGLLDTAVRTITGVGLEEIQKAIETGTLKDVPGLKLMDPVGSTMEAVGARTARESGLPESEAAKIGGATSLLAGILFPGFKGKAGKAVAEGIAAEGLAAKVGKVAAGAEEAATRINLSRVAAPEDVKAVMRSVDEMLQGEGKPLARATVGHAQTVAESKAAGLTTAEILEMDFTKFDDLRIVQQVVRDRHAAAAVTLRNAKTAVLTARDPVEQAAADKQFWAAFVVDAELATRDVKIGEAIARGLEARKIASDSARGYATKDIAALKDKVVGKVEEETRAYLKTEREAEKVLTREVAAAQKSSGLDRLGAQLNTVQQRVDDLQAKVAQAAEDLTQAGMLRETLESEQAMAQHLKERLASVKGAERDRLAKQVEASQRQVESLQAKLAETVEDAKVAEGYRAQLAADETYMASLREKIAEVRAGSAPLKQAEAKLLKAQENIEKYEQLLKDTSEAATQAGYTMDQLGALAAGHQATQAANGVTAKQLAHMLDTLDAQQRKTFMARAWDAAKQGQAAVYELWINSLLSGPQTHAANMMSNTLTAAWAPGERFLSALLNPDYLAENRAVLFGESAAMAFGAIEGTKKGLRLVARSLKERRVIEPFGKSSKIEHAPAITAEGFGLPSKAERAAAATAGEHGFDMGNAFGAGVDLFGLIVRSPGSALKLEDGFYKVLNYEMELAAQAYRIAAREKKAGKAFAQTYREVVAHPEKIDGLVERAQRSALVQTFNQELSELGWMGAVGGAIMKGRDYNAISKTVVGAVLPFVGTPTNVLHYTAERTPLLNIIAGTVARDLMKGGEARALAMGKIGTSALAGLAMYSVAMTPIDAEHPVPYMNVITGAGPKDLDLRRTLEMAGWRPYSVWNPVTKSYIGINRLDPMASVLGIITDYYEIKDQIPDAQFQELGAAMVLATMKHMTQKTYLQSLGNFLDAITGDERAFKKFTGGLERSMVPAGVRQLESYVDPALTEARTALDVVRAGIPWGNADMPSRRNLWAEKVMVPPGWGVNGISPVYSSSRTNDPVAEEIVRQKLSLRMPPKVLAGSAPPEGMQMQPERAGEGIRLTPWAYDRYVMLVGKGGDAGRMAGGPDLGMMEGLPPLREALAALMASADYKAQQNGPDGGKALRIRQKVNEYFHRAEQQLRREYPAIDTEAKKRQEIRNNLKKPAPVPGPQGAIQSLMSTLGG